MARNLRWERRLLQFPGTSQNAHVIAGPELAVGETVTRIRFQLVMTHTELDFTAEALGVMIAYGFILMPAGSVPGDVPSPWLQAEDDWMWWEGSIMVSHIFDNVTGGGTSSAGVAPQANPIARDVKSQRTAAATGDTVWFATDTDPSTPTQSDHFLSISWSVGILEVAT